MALFRLIFWFAIFVASTFVFTVLFEHGTSDFGANAQKEYATLKAMATAKSDQKKDDASSVGR